MGQTQKIGTHATTVTAKNAEISVVYHSTEVVRANLAERWVIFDNGGYETNTTKGRMNQFCNQYGLPVSVFQKRFNWFVEISSGIGIMDFKNGQKYHY